MANESSKDEFFVIVISSKKERKKLYNFCVSHQIPIKFPTLFTEFKVHHLWGIDKNGVGLVGTIIARFTPNDHIVHSVEELEKLMSSQGK